MIPRGSKWRGICAILLYQQWRDTHVNHFKSMSTAHEFCCFWETPFFYFKFRCQGLCILTSCKSRCQSLFVYPNQFSKTYSTVHGWVDPAIIWDVETNLFQTVSTNSWNQTQQLTCHKSPTDLLQQLIRTITLFRKPHFPPLPAHFFVKLQVPQT